MPRVGTSALLEALLRETRSSCRSGKKEEEEEERHHGAMRSLSGSRN